MTAISSSADDNIQRMMSLMFNSADTDRISGLSKAELSAIDTSGDVNGTEFINSLMDQFDQLDTDKNDQLSIKEIESAKPTEPMGPPPGLNIVSENTTNNGNNANQDSFGNFFGNASAAFLQKILNSYKNGGLSSVLSSLNLAG